MATKTATPSPLRPGLISWPHLVLSLAGLAASYSAYVLHKKVQAGGDACGFTDTISCNKVLASQYSEFLHIPLGVYGVVYFLIVLVMAFNTEPDASPRRTAAWRLAVAGVGLLSSITMTYISMFKIDAVCPVCLGTHTVVLLLFIFSLRSFLKSGRMAG